jgi:hypothetical protein
VRLLVSHQENLHESTDTQHIDLGYQGMYGSDDTSAVYTPYQDILLQPFLSRGSIIELKQDFRYGTQDPIQWPHPYMGYIRRRTTRQTIP